VQNAELTRDGTKLAYLRGHPGAQRVALWTTDLANGQSRELARDDQRRDFPSWSRDGLHLAYRWVRLEGAAGETSLAVRRMDTNEEELIATPGSDSVVDPWDWSADGRLILASTVLRKTGSVSLGTWPLAAAPHAETAMRVLTEDKEYTLWQGKFSPDGRWISFIAIKTREPGTATIFVMPSGGGDRSTWRAVIGPHGWADKPRWSSDGKLLYFIQQQGSFFNVWAVRFDSAAGTPVGPPFQVTNYDSPRHQLSPDLGSADIGVSLDRLVLTIMEQSGSLWMLDNVDR
jgi:Tol biopolymer transport system component